MSYEEQMNNDEILEKAVNEIRGRERQVIDDFARAVVASEALLTAKDLPWLITHLQLNQQVTHKDGQIVHHYWFTFRCDADE